MLGAATLPKKTKKYHILLLVCYHDDSLNTLAWNLQTSTSLCKVTKAESPAASEEEGPPSGSGRSLRTGKLSTPSTMYAVGASRPTTNVGSRRRAQAGRVREALTCRGVQTRRCEGAGELESAVIELPPRLPFISDCSLLL